MESLFELLFKYRPLVFENGQLVFGTPLPHSLLVLAVATAAGVTAAAYARTRERATPRDRVVLAGLRIAAMAVILFALLRPTLLISSAVPQQNYLGILIDDSRSMRTPDTGGEPRGAWVQRSFGAAESELLRALSERFRLRFFRFSSDAQRIESLDEINFAGGRTHLAAALDRGRQDLSSVPLSGLVVISDGADTHGANGGGAAETDLAESLLGLKAAGVPVFTVGVGRERFERDIEISRVASPRSTLKGSSLVVDVAVSQTGYGGQTVPLVVEDEGRIVSSQQVQLPRDDQPATVRVRFDAPESGVRRFRFRIPLQRGELIRENNEQEVMIAVRDQRERILYVEGEPRFEVKFLRRAVEDDENLQVVVLQRSAENKFLRLDVDSAAELASGFPRTREELFSYRALILGSVEASFFTHEQLRMIADFVGRRGGGLLMLGGRRSFAEGGYAGTPVANVLPVALDPSAARDTSFFVELKVALTRAGRSHAALQLAESEEESGERWAELPLLTTRNRVHQLKPGATALLTGSGPGVPNGQPVLAHQRYGRGQALAFAVQDSWTWQMHADIPLDDMTHETFWRQILRWLVSDVPTPVALTTAERVAPGEPVGLVARVADDAYLAVNNGRVVAQVTAPSGRETQVPMGWTTGRDGEYRASFTPVESGTYEIRAEASHDGRLLGSDATHLDVGESTAEFFGAQMRAPLLRRIAEETGGRFYTTATANRLPSDIRYTGTGVTAVEEKELWDMPIVFLLLIGLLAGEWGYRRTRNLA